MELKTQVKAADALPEIHIHRTFDLPVHLLYLAYSKAEFIAQWMGNTVVKLEHQNHGSYVFQKTDNDGNVLFKANGTIHSVKENEEIIRTFEMENVGFPVQLEFLTFKSTGPATSELHIKLVFKSVEDRNNQLKMPFAQGLNAAHNQLQNLMNTFEL
ncbi:MAG: ATPase [Bacteroidetes bacterium]|nr:MAG: ATPase [Bacteroidota bacterium]